MSKMIRRILIMSILALSATACSASTDIVHQSDHTPTNGTSEFVLLAQNKRKNVTITGIELKTKGLISPITVQVQGESKTFDWENEMNPSFYPELEISDADGDGQDELFLFLTKSHGTGVHEGEAHILNKELEEIAAPDVLAIADKEASDDLQLSGKMREYALTLSGETHRFTFYEDDAGMWFEHIVIGNSIHYRLENGELIASLSAQVSPGIVIGTIDIYFGLVKGQFHQTLIKFIPLLE